MVGSQTKKDELGQRQGSLGRKLTAEPWYWSVRKPKKTNLDNARDLSGVSSQQNSGIGRFAGRKCRCHFQGPRQAALLSLGPGPSRDGGSMSSEASSFGFSLSKAVKRTLPVIHACMEPGRATHLGRQRGLITLVLACAQEPI